MAQGGWTLTCERCRAAQALDSLLWCCPACGGAFRLDGPSALDAGSIGSEGTIWRYAAAMAVPREAAVTLGEGMTPLTRATLAGREVWLKNDALLPTGSFKDRGAAALASHLRRLGIERVIVDSSGNAAAAMSAYCARAGMHCHVFAPATTSTGKLVQSRAYGARVTLVEGNREAVATAAQQAAEADDGAFYASHNWHPVFVDGVKTWAFEVWEQLGRRSPAAAFVPTGGGSAFVGAMNGFGTVGAPLPRLVAAQPAACAPVVAAVERGASDIAPVTPGDTLAEGTRIGAPARQREILRAVAESGGAAAAVSEDLIRRALDDLWSQGFYVEPTAAVGAAAFIDMAERGTLPLDGDIVVLLTGSGLKATDTIARLTA